MAKPGLKQLSQLRSLIDSAPTRSLLRVTFVQKQVGQARVQLPHVMQRSATSVQRGESSFAMSRSRRPAVWTGFPIAARTPATAWTAVTDWSSRAALTGSRASSSAPVGVPTSITKPAGISVRARSWPPRTSGPVSMEVQKQVDAAVMHCTATTRVARRRSW